MGILLAVSILASVLNELFVNKLNRGELYPFTNWKLYTMPFGNKFYAEDLRFYGYDHNAKCWSRIPLKPTDNMSKTELIYAINFQAKPPITREKIVNMRYLAQKISNGYEKYKLVLECYDQRNLTVNTSLFDTLTVVKL